MLVIYEIEFCTCLNIAFRDRRESEEDDGVPETLAAVEEIEFVCAINCG